MDWLGLYNYWIVVVLMMMGLWIIVAHGNLMKKLVGLNVFQVSVILFYVTMIHSPIIIRTTTIQ